MLIERIKTYFNDNGYENIGVNVKDIYLLYYAKEHNRNLIMVFNSPEGTEFSWEQYDNIKRQLYHNFEQKGIYSIPIQTIICTNHVEIAKNRFGSETYLWFLDMKTARLILYENQVSDFNGIRKGLESVLFDISYNYSTGGSEYNNSFGTYDRSFEAENNSGDLPKQTFIGKYFSKCNTFLVILNVIVFFLIDSNIFSVKNSHLLDAGALYWPAVVQNGEYYRLFTYMFLHYGFDHLFNNMIVLLVLGDNLERAVGKWRYLVLYFMSGIIAGGASMGYNMLNNTYVISVGASGAIFGVVGAMAYIVAVNKGRLETITTRQMIVFVVLSLYSGLTSKGVDNAAHIGGLIAGILLAAIVYRVRRKDKAERG